MIWIAAAMGIVGLLLSGFFSGSETGFYRLSRTRLMADELRQICGEPWFTEAPYVLAVVSIHRQTQTSPRDFGPVDCASVLSQLMLAATNEGLGTCWVGDFNPWKACGVLQLPDYAVPVAFTPLGYPGSKHYTEMLIMPQLDDLLMYDHWGGEEDRREARSWLADPSSSGRKPVYKRPKPKDEQ